MMEMKIMKKLISVILLLCGFGAANAVELDTDESFCPLNEIVGTFNCKASDAGEQVLFWHNIAGEVTVKLTPDKNATRIYSLQLAVPDTVWIKSRPKKNAKEGKHYRLVKYYDAVATLPGNPKNSEYYTPRRSVAGKRCVVEGAVLSSPDSITVLLSDGNGRKLTLGYRTTDGGGFIPMTILPELGNMLNHEYYMLTYWSKAEHSYIANDFTHATRLKPLEVNAEIVYNDRKGDLLSKCRLKCLSLDNSNFSPSGEFDFAPNANNRLVTANQYKRICEPETLSLDKLFVSDNKVDILPIVSPLPAGINIFQTFGYKPDLTRPGLAKLRVGRDTVALNYPDSILLCGHITRGGRNYYLGGVEGHPVFVDAAAYNDATGLDFIGSLPDADRVPVDDMLALAAAVTDLENMARIKKCVGDKPVVIGGLSMQGELPDATAMFLLLRKSGTYSNIFPTAYRSDRNNLFFNVYNNSGKTIKKIKLDFNGYLDNGKQYIPESVYSPTFSAEYDKEISDGAYIPVFAVDPFKLGHKDVTIKKANIVSVTIRYADGTVSHPKPSVILLDDECSALLDNRFSLIDFN